MDSHVARHLFDRCICSTHPLSGIGRKTRLLVTHQVALTLPRADFVVIVGSGGVVLEQGRPEELRRKGGHLNELLRALGNTDDDDNDTDTNDDGNNAGSGRDSSASGEDGDDREGVNDTGDADRTAGGSSSSSSSSSDLSSEKLKKKKHLAAAAAASSEGDGDEEAEAAAAAHEDSRQLVKEEERAVGAPALAVYKAYAVAAGGWGAVCLISFFTVSVTGLSFLVKLTMALWVKAMEGGEKAEEDEGLWRYLGATAASVAAVGVWILSRQVRSLVGWFNDWFIDWFVHWLVRSVVCSVVYWFGRADRQSVSQSVVLSIRRFYVTK